MRRKDCMIGPGMKDLLLHIALMLNRTQPHEAEGEIDQVLELVTRNSRVDQLVFLLFPIEKSAGTVIKCYSMAGSERTSMKTSDTPWLIKQLKNRETVALSVLPDDLPPHVTRDRQYLTEAGIKSVLALPLQAGALAMGGLLVFSKREAAPFSKKARQEFAHLAEMVASVISRKRAAEGIDDILAYDHLLSDISATYINLPASSIDKVMSKDLGRLAQLLGADRCILYLAEEDGKTFRPYLHSGWWLEEDKARVVKHNKLWERHDPLFIDGFRYLFDRWRKGEHVQWTQLDHLPPDGEKMKEAYRTFHCKSQLSVPVSVSGSTVAVLTVSNNHLYKTWPEELIPRLRLFGEVFANALARKKSEEALQNAFAEVRRLKERFEADYTYLRNSLDVENDFRGIIGQSDALEADPDKGETGCPNGCNRPPPR